MASKKFAIKAGCCPGSLSSRDFLWLFFRSFLPLSSALDPLPPSSA
uniref:SLX4 interacting protein n=1 Tax=Pipistrellus kuhlii TaxID=59472 RepID=A0A7J7YAR2_PIPKU|nr:SLX4 interacting protein [Pipistrellus kuhlii]